MSGPEEREQRTEATTPDLSFEDTHIGEFEQALARAMRRVEVRAETTAKFLALAEEAERKRLQVGGSGGLRLIKFSNVGRVFTIPRPRAWMGGAIAAVLAIGVFAATHIHEQREQHERQMQAQQQFETAERITDETLARTRAELARQGIYLDQD